MPLVIVGVLLLAAKFAGLGPVADLAWWWVLAPFAGAAVWWAFADATGVTQRRAMQKMEDRKTERRNRAMDDLGLGTRRQVKGGRSASAGEQPTRTGSGAAGASKEPRL